MVKSWFKFVTLLFCPEGLNGMVGDWDSADMRRALERQLAAHVVAQRDPVAGASRRRGLGGQSCRMGSPFWLIKAKLVHRFGDSIPKGSVRPFGVIERDSLAHRGACSGLARELCP